MISRSSTLRSTADATVGQEHPGPRPPALQHLVAAEWRKSGQADLVETIERHPQLLSDRSLLLNLAIEEYKAQRDKVEALDLEQHCRRFREFGSSVERSIFRQLETQRYIDGHPELLELLQSPNWPEVGEEFGSFHVVEELGRGAMARVYLCRQLDVGNRTVVVKATPFSGIEASVLGRLNHPNIIPIHSTGVVEECHLHFLCMPFCGRSTLNDVVDLAFQREIPRTGGYLARAANRWGNNGEQPPKGAPGSLLENVRGRTHFGDVLTIASQIADALDHAHCQDVLHGDLKPSNVLLTPDGQPLLLDFNLSRDLSSPVGTIGGTLSYMSPECLKIVAARYPLPPDEVSLGHTADIYSFGVLVYELLAGVTPTAVPHDTDDPARAADALLQQMKDGIRSVREVNPLVSKRIDTLLTRCLAFDPHDRPASAAEIKRMLQCERRVVPSIGRQARVRPYAFATLCALLLAVAGSAAAYMAFRTPRHLVDFNRGLEHAELGNFDHAIPLFESATRANPEFMPARFQLGRARAALGQLDLAIDDIGNYARSTHDPHSMAYLGYCFNLKGVAGAAIPWYERALESGAETAAIYNNLGASYLSGPSRLSRQERIQHVDSLLHRAVELDNASPVVRLNLVRLELAKSLADVSHDPIAALPHVEAIISSSQDYTDVRMLIASWYHVTLERSSAPTGQQRQEPANLESVSPTTHRFLEEVLAENYHVDPKFGFARVPRSNSSRTSSPTSPSRRYYIEPIVVDQPGM